MNIRIKVESILLSFVSRYYQSPNAPFAKLIRVLAQAKMRRLRNKQSTPKVEDPWLQCHLTGDQSDAWPNIWGKIRKIWIKHRSAMTIFIRNSVDWDELPLPFLFELKDLNARVKSILTGLSIKINSAKAGLLLREMSEQVRGQIVEILSPLRVENIPQMTPTPFLDGNAVSKNWGYDITPNGPNPKPIIHWKIGTWYNWIIQTTVQTPLHATSSKGFIRLWKLRIPEFERQRVWRLLINRQPRVVGSTSSCPCLNGANLAPSHVFRNCRVFLSGLQMLRYAISIVYPSVNTKFTHIGDLLAKPLTTRGDEIWTSLVCIYHQSIWLSICNHTHQGTPFTEQYVIDNLIGQIRRKMISNVTCDWQTIEASINTIRRR